MPQGGQLALHAQQALFVVRFVQFVDQGRSSSKANGETLLTGGQPRPSAT
jgi:hypothetical protein